MGQASTSTRLGCHRPAYHRQYRVPQRTGSAGVFVRDLGGFPGTGSRSRWPADVGRVRGRGEGVSEVGSHEGPEGGDVSFVQDEAGDDV